MHDASSPHDLESVRTLRGVSVEAQHQIRAWIQAAVQTWYFDYAGAPGLESCPEVTVVPYYRVGVDDPQARHRDWNPSPINAMHWQFIAHGESLTEEDWLTELGTKLSGIDRATTSPPESSLTHGHLLANIASIAWSKLFQKLLSASETRISQNLTPENPDAWSGHAFARIPCFGGELQLLISPSVVLAWCELPSQGQVKPINSPTLVSLRQVLAGQHLSLSVHLNSIDLTLSALKALQLGDVVVLSHELQEPLTLVDMNQQTLANAWLGRDQDFRAIQLI